MIDRNRRLSVTRQARMLGISRASVYYIPRPVSEVDLKLMRAMDELHLEYPFAGSRMLRDMLRQDSFDVGRKHVATLMRRMGIEALYRKPRTTRRHPEHRVYPYLLREMDVCQPQPGLGHGHHVYPDGTRICLSRGGTRLVLTASVGVAGIDIDGHGVLHRSS